MSVEDNPHRIIKLALKRAGITFDGEACKIAIAIHEALITVRQKDSIVAGIRAFDEAFPKEKKNAGTT
jgi:hypothetical protein